LRVSNIEHWYSPAFILEAADMAVQHCKDRGIRPAALDRVIGEARATAIFAIGFSQQSGHEVWMRMVEPSEQAPDCLVMYVEKVGRSNHQQRLEVEVTTYNSHSSDDLASFLLRTKFDGNHSYSPSTVILVYVQRGMDFELLQSAHDRLTEVSPRGVGYCVGQVDADLFQVMQLYSRLAGPVNVRLSEALASNQLPVADVRRGMSALQGRTEKPVPTDNPFFAYL